MSLLYWCRKWEISDNMLWKDAAVKQMTFIRDVVCTNLLKVNSFVISNHISKSILLPVYAFVMKNDVKVIARDNFYDWKLTIKLPKHYGDIPKELFSGGYKDNIPEYLIEGFANSWCFNGYDPKDMNQLNFTMELHTDYNFYVLMFILKNAFKDKKFNNKKLTKFEIIDKIKRIYKDNGFYEDCGMSGFEIFYNTFKTIEKEKNIYDILHLPDNPEMFADEIISNDKAMKAFIFDLYCYENDFYK